VKRETDISAHPIKPLSLNPCAAVCALMFISVSFLISSTVIYGSKVNYLPDIILTNQNSRSISLSSLRGKPVLVGFIHTMCKGVCQMMTANMRSIASALPPARAADVTMLLITTDPSDDRSPELSLYAKNQDLSGHDWVLVTGPQDRITQVMRLYGVKHEESDDAMMHVMKLFLLTPGGALAHVYLGMNVSPQTVVEDIERMSQHASKEPSKSPEP
jgi:cytochrome oxidase Cu insertion factor (SCO1/SenC/PrrC family)